MRRTPLFALGAALAVALTTGCGGSPDSAPGAPLTKAEWVTQADQICADATARIEALGKPESARELASVTEDAVAINDKALASIRALGPPAEIEEQVSRAIELSERENEIARAIAAAADKRDQATVQRLSADLAPLEREAQRVAGAIGLTKCGAR